MIDSRSTPIDTAWYDAHVRHSTHSLSRFVKRAQPPAGFSAAALLRDLATCQGRLVSERPHWARSRRTADAYLQIGEFLFLLLEHDERRPGSYSCVTVLNGARWKTWQIAYERGWVALAPPVARPLTWTPQQLEEIRRRAWQHALAAVGDAEIPTVRGRWLSRARQRSRAARDAAIAAQHRRVHETFEHAMADVEAEHARDLAALEHWEQVTGPAYQAPWRQSAAANQR